MAGRDVIRWGNPPSGVYNTPVYLALQRGAFGTPAMRVEARDNVTGADYTEELVAGRFDMGHMGTPPLFAALTRTRAYTIVGQGIVRYPCFYLIAPPGVATMRDLGGKAVGLNKLRTCPHSIVRTLLARAGMSEADVTLRTFGNAWKINDAIRAGELAAAVQWEPYVSHAERAFGWRIFAEGRTVIDPSNYGFCLYARRDLVADDPGLVRHVIGQYAAGIEYAVKHLDEAAPTLYGKLPHVLNEDVDRGLRRDARDWTSDPSIDHAFLEFVLGELKDQTIVPRDFALHEVLDGRAA